MHFLDSLLGVRLTPPALLSRLVHYHLLLATGLLVKCDFCPSLNITISAESLPAPGSLSSHCLAHLAKSYGSLLDLTLCSHRTQQRWATAGISSLAEGF